MVGLYVCCRTAAKPRFAGSPVTDATVKRPLITASRSDAEPARLLIAPWLFHGRVAVQR